MKRSVGLAAVAKDAMKNSYAPYSNLHVGAAVQTVDGKIYSGCNVENAVFAATVCAERTAIAKAVSEGSRFIARVFVTSDAEEPLLPCGICLQTISEFSKDGRTQIMSLGKNGKTLRFNLGTLFPSGIKVHRTIRSVTG